MSQQQVLKRLQDSRQSAILQQQSLCHSVPLKIRCLTSPISASTSHIQIDMPSLRVSDCSSTVHLVPTNSSNSSNLHTSSTKTHRDKVPHTRVNNEMPSNIRTIEDHLKTQLRQERARVQHLSDELKRNDPAVLREANQTSHKKLQLATDRITSLENENMKLAQNERQNLSAERVLSRIMQEDPGFISKLHAAQLALLNPNPPRNVNTLSRKLMRKQARLKAFNRKKEAEALLQNDTPTNNSNQALRPLPPPVDYVPITDEYIDLDY